MFQRSGSWISILASARLCKGGENGLNSPGGVARSRFVLFGKSSSRNDEIEATPKICIKAGLRCHEDAVGGDFFVSTKINFANKNRKKTFWFPRVFSAEMELFCSLAGGIGIKRRSGWARVPLIRLKKAASVALRQPSGFQFSQLFWFRYNFQFKCRPELVGMNFSKVN